MSHRFLLHHVEIQQAKVNANKEPSQDQNQKYCLCRRRNCFNARTQLRFTVQINLYSASWNIHVLRDCAVLDVVPPLLYRIVSHLWKKLPKARKKVPKIRLIRVLPSSPDGRSRIPNRNRQQIGHWLIQVRAGVIFLSLSSMQLKAHKLKTNLMAYSMHCSHN